MIPLYGFLEGDTIGLLMLGREDETVGSLAARLETSARLRVGRKGRLSLIYKGKTLDDGMTLARAGLVALDRFDVIAFREGVAR